ncbi:MAG: GFA family protein [Myxococcales bacterium]|nr:GFA family protein [Myxococcales bacterium]
MSQSRDPQGGCRCGRIRFEIGGPALMTMACHCVGCQRMTGSAFSLSAAIPSEAFRVTHGEPVIGGLHGPTRHYFCSHCMSWLFTRPEGMDAFVNLRPTMLDEPGALATPFIETWTRERLSWVSTAAVHSFEEFPPLEAFEPLMREFASLER